MEKAPPPYDYNIQPGSTQMSQPGQVTIVNSQPQSTMQVKIVQGNVNMPRGIPRDWSTGLFGCFEDIGSCALGFFCSPCFAGCVASDMGEQYCTPCCAGTLAMRTNFRGKHNLQGSIINDCCVITYCGLCATCQMKRELDNMKAGRAAP